MRGIVSTYLAGFLLFFACITSAGNRSYADNLYDIPAPADTTKQADLLKRLAEALKFRKKAISREEKRVITIINKIVKDSSAVGVHDLEKLRADLSGSTKAELDTLFKLIQQIEAQTAKAADDPAEEGLSEADSSAAENNKQIKDLIDKILAKDKQLEIQEKKRRQDKLKLIRQIAQKPKVFTDTINDSTALERMIRLKGNAEVWGYHLYEQPEHDYNFKNIHTLVFHSFEVNPASGGSKNFGALHNVGLIRRAREAGCKIILSATTESVSATSTFLRSPDAQKNFIRNTLKFFADHSANGINIDFTGVNRQLAPQFMTFISYLSEAYKSGKEQYLVSVTIPPFDKEDGYLLNALAPFTDRFVINFTRPLPGPPGPLAPLKQQSDYSIETCVSRYLNTTQVPPEKLILCLPYYGVKWNVGSNKVALIPYKEIRSDYQNLPVTYDEDAATAVISIRNGSGDETSRIWFDNENTLGSKYDFILKNGLAGVAVRDLGADQGYGELSDELAYKFLDADTVISKRISLLPPDELKGWAFFVHSIKHYISVLEDPCDNDKDRKVDRRVLSYINIALLMICGIIAIFCVLRIKQYGDAWRWKKTVLIILTVFVILLITTAFMWIYLDSEIPWFGVDKDCIDMPFHILYSNVVIGIILGLLVMRFLVFPVIKKEDIP